MPDRARHDGDPSPFPARAPAASLSIMPRFLLLPFLFASTAACGQIHGRIYPAPTAPLTAAALPAGATVIRVTTRDGLSLTGAAVPARDGRPTLLVFHGNASSAAGTLIWFAPLIARGYRVVAAEYRGYSGNPGRADETGLAADADAFYTEARARAGTGRLIVVGHSLGGGVAFGLARRVRLEALVTIGAFTGLRAMAPKIARALIGDRYDNLAAVPLLDEPLFLLHGTADDVVPVAMGNALYHAAVAAKREGGAVVIDGAGHQPDGALLATIIDAVTERLATPAAAWAAIGGVTFYTFR